ncbi:hypothetical protein E2C01_022990 [Portunus trituberculatus]|uniref:Uncharacterized protein n=1 Tax=Portunus trituberculatus TaxID=210409 RepID=A0A5B7E6V9_PORTR|nr:hypothetical protein [Portunus trituberculatus]
MGFGEDSLWTQVTPGSGKRSDAHVPDDGRQAAAPLTRPTPAAPLTRVRIWGPFLTAAAQTSAAWVG